VQNQSSYNGGNRDSTTGGNYCSYCRKPGHVRQNFFKLKQKDSRYGHTQASNKNRGNCDRENYDSQDLVFVAISKNENYKEDICTCDSIACGHY
jgi:hypothetical protein